MKFVVKGKNSRQVKWFHCNEDAYDFFDECDWDEPEVFVCYPAKRKPKKTAFHEKSMNAAVRILEWGGYEILERDYSTPVGDLDIIAEDEDGTLVFVTVKISDDFGVGFDDSDIESMRPECEKAAAFFLQQNGFIEAPMRFDVISFLVCGSFDRAMCRHITNIFGEI